MIVMTRDSTCIYYTCISAKTCVYMYLVVCVAVFILEATPIINRYLRSEMDSPEFSQRFGILLEAYLRGCGEGVLVSVLETSALIRIHIDNVSPHHPIWHHRRSSRNNTPLCATS